MIRAFVRDVIQEYWSQNLDKVMTDQDDIEQEEPEDMPNDNVFDANTTLRKSSANAHVKTQKAGVGKGSGPAGAQRFPGGKNT